MALSDRLTNYYREARWRAQRRKSAWNILLSLFCIDSGLTLWYAVFQLVWAFHAAVYPDHQFSEFWRAGIGPSSFALSFLMVFAPVPSAITLGFMLGNVMAWFIPPARRTLDAEAEGYPRTSFRDSMLGVARICVWTPLSGLCIFITAYSLSSLR